MAVVALRLPKAFSDGIDEAGAGSASWLVVLIAMQSFWARSAAAAAWSGALKYGISMIEGSMGSSGSKPTSCLSFGGHLPQY